jgi:hypothetical protein
MYIIFMCSIHRRFPSHIRVGTIAASDIYIKKRQRSLINVEIDSHPQKIEQKKKKRKINVGGLIIGLGSSTFQMKWWRFFFFFFFLMSTQKGRRRI